MAGKTKNAGRAMARAQKPSGPVPVQPEPQRGVLYGAAAGDSLQNFVAGMNTDRDKRTHSFYGMPCVLGRQELENMYRGSWVAKRIVNNVADDMTKEWRRFSMGDQDDNPNLEALVKAEKDLRVAHLFNEGIRWARLYGGAVLILGIRGQRDLSKPLNVKQLDKGCLQWIRVLDRWRLSPGPQLDLDLSSTNYAMPSSYLVAESAVEVHASRIIRLNGEKLPWWAWLQNARWDDSCLQHVLDALKNNDTISSAIATMMFEANVDVVTSPGLSDLLSTADGETKAVKRWQLAALMKSFNRMLLLDGEDKYEKKANTFANLADVWSKAQDDVCGAAEQPRTRLFGDSPGGLNAQGDSELENYYGHIGAKQKNELGPRIDQFDEVFVRHVLGRMDELPTDYSYEWNELWAMSEKDDAQLTYNRAQRDHIYIQDGVVTPGLVASELKQTKTYSSMSNEDVAMAQELGQPMNPDQQLDEDVTRTTTMNKVTEQTDPNFKLQKQNQKTPPAPKKKANGTAGVA